MYLPKDTEILATSRIMTRKIRNASSDAYRPENKHEGYK